MTTMEFIQNSAILVGFLVVMYCLARVVATVSSAIAARRLAPLAPLIDGHADPKRGVLVGTFMGRKVEVLYSPKQSVGRDESATRIKAVEVTVLDLAGKGDWWLEYHVSGLLGQGPKRLSIGTRDPELTERLSSTGIVAEVEASNAGTCTYLAARFERFSKRLTYLDDISPRVIPTPEVLQRQLEMAVRLADINDQVNR